MTFQIKDDLKFANGDPIMASDYVFYTKMLASQSYVYAGASSTAGQTIVGYEEWNAGCYFDGDTTDCDADHDYAATPLDFSGIQVVSDYEFSITVKADEFPYFYDLSLFGLSPANEALFLDDGEYALVGTTLSTEEGYENTVGSRTAGDYIKTFVDNPVQGLFAGPYYFIEYLVGQSVKLQANPYFVGDYRGHQPKILQLIVKVVPSATDMESLISGDIELLTGVVEGDKIDQGISTYGIARAHYPRNGFGAIFFHIDHDGPIGDKYVRKAIAYMLDREAFVDAFTSGYAEIVNGPYGLSQWMYQENAEWVNTTLTNYELDYAMANDMLDMTDYKFESDGTTAFDETLASDTYQRYNSSGELLEVTWLGMADTDYQALLKPELLRGAEKVGMELVANTGDWPTLLDTYYYADSGSCSDTTISSKRLCEEDASATWTDNTERGDDAMFNLATGFADLYDPYWSYHSDFYNQWMNSSQVDSADVDTYTKDMQQAQSKEDFVAAWKLFQVWMNDNLPLLPLYSNDYHDFFNTKLKGFDTTSIWDWTAAIVDCYVTE
jgi:peptide/nickel transport system substrate-binding protein